jgi:hypothetical protein
MKTDGTMKSKLSDDYSQYITVSGDWVYYSNAYDEWKIYKVKKDGSGRIKVNDTKSYYLNANDKYIYFSDENINGKLSMIKIN